MLKFFIQLKTFLIINLFISTTVHGIIAPIKISPDRSVLLLSCEEIKLTYEQIDLYHHPLGIWLIEYEAVLENMRAQTIKQLVSFPSGFDIRVIGKDMYCDRFENFQVFVNDNKMQNIKYLVKCANYVETTGTEWTLDDGSGIGFLNTWELNFKPEETKRIKITFSFNVNKPPVNFDPNNNESWYTDLMEWTKSDYSTREQNQFKLPLNLGSFWAFYPDSIVIRTYLAKDWLRVIDKSKRKYKNEHITRYEFSESFGFFSPPEVSLISPTSAELEKMTTVELRILKNSFIAKYGKIFKSKILKLFFNYQPWYTENPSFNQWYLTDWDIENLKFIHEFEKNSK